MKLVVDEGNDLERIQDALDKTDDFFRTRGVDDNAINEDIVEIRDWCKIRLANYRSASDAPTQMMELAMALAYANCLHLIIVTQREEQR